MANREAAHSNGSILPHLFDMLRAAFWRWYGDNTFRLGAALAYYTVFSLAPIVLIAVGIAGLVFGEEAARKRLLEEIDNTVGSQVGQAIAATSQHIEDTESGLWATIISVIVLFFGATGVFAQLQDSLNVIWGVKPREDRGWLDAIKDRFWSFSVVLGMGFLLLVSLIISTILATLTRLVTPEMLPGSVYVWQAVNWLVSFGVVMLLFAMIYKLLPDAKVEWHEVWVGAAVTAVLFAIGRYLIGLYLGQSAWISGYGAAGSLIVILLWVYYSSQILLFGAEFTYVYANRTGKPLVPKVTAEPVTEEARARQGIPPTSDATPGVVAISDVTEAAIAPLHEYGRSDPPLLVQLLGMIAVILPTVRDSDARAALLRQAELIRHEGDAWPDAANRETLERHYRDVLRVYHEQADTIAQASHPYQ